MVVPCSGIGKTYGTVIREAAYEVTEDRRPGTTDLVALSLLVLGDEDARARVRAHPAVTIDGCKLACAAKMVQENGGHVAADIAVLDVYRRNRELKPRASPSSMRAVSSSPMRWPPRSPPSSTT